MAIPNPKLYLEEKKKWEEAGSPLRSDERIEELFNICEQCEHSIKITSKIRNCSVCGCMLRKSGYQLNKLAWSTTRCPLDNPKWTEEEKVAEEIPQRPQKIQRPPKTGSDCGCG